MTPAVLAQDQLTARKTDVFRTHDLVGQPMHEHAVLMDARLVSERILPYDGFVALHLDAGDVGYQPAGRIQTLGLDAGSQAEIVGARFQSHDHLFQGTIAGALPQTIDGTFDLPGSFLDGGQTVGHCQTQIVMAVHAQYHAVYTAHVLSQVADRFSELTGHSIAHSIGDIDGRGAGLDGPFDHFRGQASSQFASGLLLAAPWAGRPITIEIVPPLVSRPYVDMTLAMLRAWGVRVHTDDRADRLDIQVMPFCGEAPSQYVVEPDATAASYFFAAAAITGGQITVPGLSYASLQGDVRFVRVLERMGCQVQSTDAGITVRGGPLHGIEVDMQDISDTVMTLAVVALFARGPTAIRNVAHIRHKESDRLHALATELSRLGARVTELSDGLVIYPGPLRPGRVETYQDHRLAMSLALVGLKVPGVHIADPGCVAKTYPDFWRDLATLRL